MQNGGDNSPAEGQGRAACDCYCRHNGEVECFEVLLCSKIRRVRIQGFVSVRKLEGLEFKEVSSTHTYTVMRRNSL